MKDTEIAYIAGFLEGDGCIMMQLVRSSGYIYGYQIRASIVFYQKQLHKQYLVWLKKKLVYGYVRDRNDGMSEYTIVGIKYVFDTLTKLYPYLKLKRKQANLVFKIVKYLTISKRMSPIFLIKMAKLVDCFADLNYSKKRTITSESVRQFLVDKRLLDSVETDP